MGEKTGKCLCGAVKFAATPKPHGDRMKDGGLFSVSAGALDDLSDSNFTTEIFVDEKPDFYDFAQNTKKMMGAEVMAAFANGESAS